MKRFLSVTIILCLIITLFSNTFTFSAKEVYGATISIDKVSAVVGDTVIVPIRIKNNPGLMATTISITYNSDALEINYYYKGDFLRDYTVQPHPDKNIIRFVNCEAEDKIKDGVLVNLQFKVKDTADADFHEISIDYKSGDFCNYDLDRIMPKIETGGVEVAFNGSNCKHKKYGEWTVAAAPTCDECGAEQRVCNTCGHIELRDIAALGHTYSDSWTIDKPATKTEDGMMTRYCIRCDDYVDRITFSLAQAEDGKIDNTEGAKEENNKFLENLFKEQNKGKELTTSKPASNPNNAPNGFGSVSGTGNLPAENSNSVLDEKPSNQDSAGTGLTETIGSILEGSDILPNSTTNGVTLSAILAKIAEVFPNFNTIANSFSVAIVLLLAVL